MFPKNAKNNPPNIYAYTKIVIFGLLLFFLKIYLITLQLIEKNAMLNTMVNIVKLFISTFHLAEANVSTNDDTKNEKLNINAGSIIHFLKNI